VFVGGLNVLVVAELCGHDLAFYAAAIRRIRGQRCSGSTVHRRLPPPPHPPITRVVAILNVAGLVVAAAEEWIVVAKLAILWLVLATAFHGVGWTRLSRANGPTRWPLSVAAW